MGGNPVTWSNVMDFHNCVEECELIELPHIGNSFTWNDKGDILRILRIFSKID